MGIFGIIQGFSGELDNPLGLFPVVLGSLSPMILVRLRFGAVWGVSCLGGLSCSTLWSHFNTLARFYI
jgi:hypothetical protein